MSNPRPNRKGLRPWKKGQTGNPRGGSKLARERAKWKPWLESLEPEVMELLAGMVRGHRPASEGFAVIKRVPIGERRRAAEFLATHLHGQPKQTVEADWPATLHIHVDPTDVGPGRKE